MNTPISFCYKGDRDYVHGTDIFNKAVAVFAEQNILENGISDIAMSINNISRNSLSLVSAESVLPGAKVAVRFNIQNQNKQEQFFLVEDGEPIVCRYPYPENDIIAAAEFSESNDEICLRESLPFSLIEIIVALNKGLLQKKFSDAQGKWFFTKIKLNNFEGSKGKVSVKYQKSLGLKLVESSVSVDDMTIGSLYFSLV